MQFLMGLFTSLFQLSSMDFLHSYQLRSYFFIVGGNVISRSKGHSYSAVFSVLVFTFSFSFIRLSMVSSGVWNLSIGSSLISMACDPPHYLQGCTKVSFSPFSRTYPHRPRSFPYSCRISTYEDKGKARYFSTSYIRPNKNKNYKNSKKQVAQGSHITMRRRGKLYILYMAKYTLINWTEQRLQPGL